MSKTRLSTGAVLAGLIGLMMVSLLQPARPVSAQILSSDASVAPTSRFFTPKTYDADGVEELFNRVAKFGGVAYLPAATYRIGRTIKMEGLGPIRIEGEGYGDPYMPDKTGYQSRPTRLLWTGPAGGTMLHINGSNGPSFQYMMFDGGGKAGTLVQLNARPGWGTGNLRFERIAFCNADTGVQCGSDAKEVNCADLVFDETIFLRLKTGFRTVNDQSVNHHFRTLSAVYVNTMLDCQRGGNVSVFGWGAAQFDTFLKVGSAGPFAGTYYFAGGRPEMVGLTRRYPRLVETGNEIENCDITFQSTQEGGGAWDDKLPRNDDEAAFYITKGVMLTVRNHSHYRPFVSMSGGIARSEDSRWHFDPNLPGAARSTGGELTISEPRDMYGKRFADLRRGQ